MQGKSETEKGLKKIKKTRVGGFCLCLLEFKSQGHDKSFMLLATGACSAEWQDRKH